MGTVLEVYIATTITSFLMVTISSKAIDEKLDREGYVYTKEKEKGPAEKILENIKGGLIMIMPVINVVFGLIGFFGYNDLYKSALELGLNDGSIRKKTEEEKEEQKRKKIEKQKEKENKKLKTKTQVITKEVIINKPYSLMTNEEKLAVLEKEREFLLSMNKPTEETPYNDKGGYGKRPK